MSTNPKTSPDPVVPAVVPYLVCANAMEAIAFYKEAFGAQEVMAIPGADGKLMHATLTINGSTVMLTEENPEYGAKAPGTLGGTPVSIHLVVPDADATAERAVKAGATMLMPLEDAFWGDRFGMLQDPYGHQWAVVTPQKVLSETEMREAAKAYSAGLKA